MTFLLCEKNLFFRIANFIFIWLTSFVNSSSRSSQTAWRHQRTLPLDWVSPVTLTSAWSSNFPAALARFFPQKTKIAAEPLPIYGIFPLRELKINPPWRNRLSCNRTTTGSLPTIARNETRVFVIQLKPVYQLFAERLSWSIRARWRRSLFLDSAAGETVIDKHDVAPDAPEFIDCSSARKQAKRKILFANENATIRRRKRACWRWERRA